ncbi:type II toxin-antitoxin system YafQ family toxin [uncultured Mobiluncus sp.]|uniref:type II toxin-antitoxin system YafQ family toxin n=1 Tax=uncultured Mobiluncus sp. TaxID=293425 RepID=UPI00288A7225|nr:type II toxin-antitoxin system YafQ family toxin [uncultured Mobiluncus sp.]
MLKLKTTAQFRKDYKRIKKRGYNLSLLQDVLETLCEEKSLDAKYKDHALMGAYKGFRECHVQPDWLLIYTIDKDKLILVAARTGSHADLFNM